MATLDAEALRELKRRGHDRAARARQPFWEAVTTGAVDALLDAAAVRGGTRMLDIACGPGDLVTAAVARGATVLGVELAPGPVAVARGGRQHAVSFRPVGAGRLPFAEASVDAVVCNFGIGRFDRPGPVAVEIVRVLARGGRAALSWWDEPARARVTGVFYDAMAEAGVAPAGVSPGMPLLRFSDDAELRALLTIAGLEDVTVHTLAWTHRMTSAEAWWQAGLGSLVPATASVLAQPPGVRQRIRIAFDRLVERHRDDEGFAAPVSAKIAAGRKP